jgi:hypothetical protein
MWVTSMVEPEFGTFDRAFRRVYGAYRLKLNATELETLSRTYFKVLDYAPLEDVLAAAKAWMLEGRKFPTIADWVDALPAPPVSAIAADLRVMATAEREAYWRAEALRYRDDPCGCVDCRDAGMAEHALRFVPDDVNGVLDRAIDPVRNRIVVTGHWAHGEELARWYVARDAFFTSAPRRSPLGRALLVLVSREPGEDG